MCCGTSAPPPPPQTSPVSLLGVTISLLGVPVTGAQKGGGGSNDAPPPPPTSQFSPSPTDLNFYACVGVDCNPRVRGTPVAPK